MKLPVLALPVLLACLAVPAAAQSGDPTAPDPHAGHDHGPGEHVHAPAARTPPDGPRGWPDAVVEQIEQLPVQDGGRVKPFHTYAGFTLLRLHGSRSVRTRPLPTEDGEREAKRLTPVEWALDVLLRPDASELDELFLVQNGEVLEAIGLPLGAERGRTRHSFEELMPAVNQLFQLAREYSRIEEKDRNPVQQQTVALASNVDSYLRLHSQMRWAREVFPLGDSEVLVDVFGGRTHVRFHDVVENASRLQVLRQQLEASEDPLRVAEGARVRALVDRASHAVQAADDLAWLPPVASADAEPEWLTPVDVYIRAMQGRPVESVHVEALADWEDAAAQPDDPVVVAHALAGVVSGVKRLASARGEGDGLDLELTYYKLDLLTWSLSLFVLGFLACAGFWMRPKSTLAYRAAWTFSGVAYALLTAVIVMRCIIRGRPPVSTLYETVLFVAATGGLSALFIEAINRKRIALSAAAILGMVMLFIANGYEMLDKRDTMPSLVAVLDTNFWLATHVTTITMGYAAGMLAALLGSIWILGRVLRWKADEPAFYRGLSRMTYGVICFAATLSIVGTILGGIWANDSWGRFWGWDPKENGALMIVIWQVAMLHGRMAGLLRDKGFAVASAFGGTVIAFSWWGVNLLGVGLHSYGFTSGIHSALWTYYAVQWGVAGLGILAVPGLKASKAT